MSTRKEYVGGAERTTLSGTINAGATSFTVADGTGYPTGAHPFVLVIGRDTANEEKILCSARTGNVFTVSQRGYDGTSAAGHTAGAYVEHVLDSITVDEVNDWASAVQTKGGLVTMDANGDPVARTVGTNGLPLVARSSNATGLAYETLDSGAIAAGAIDETHLSTGAVTTTKLAANAVTTAKLAADAVEATNIAGDAVTSSKILDGAVGSAKLADAAVTTVKINDNAVTNAKLANDAVDTAEIATSAVTATKIADGAITTAKLADGDVTPVKQAAGPKCILNRSTNFNINDGIEDEIPWDDEESDSEGMHTGSQSTITVSEDGVWSVQVRISGLDVGATFGEGCWVTITAGGKEWKFYSITDRLNQAFTVTTYCAEASTIKVQVENQTGGTITINPARIEVRFLSK